MDQRLKDRPAPAPTLQRQPRAPRRVFVHDLELIASIGIFEHEHRYMQRLLVSLDLDVADEYDGQSDDITKVYDYSEAIAAAEATLDEGHINLLETAAERIAQRCLTNPSVVSVRVRLEKPDAFAACRSVGIEIHRFRTQA